MSAPILRNRVLTLYKRLLRLGQSWNSVKPEDLNKEREFIATETRELFAKNRDLRDPGEIKDRVQEAEARIEMALHYRIPYPRPVNLPSKSLAMDLKKGKEDRSFQQKIKKQSRPIYIKSIDQ